MLALLCRYGRLTYAPKWLHQISSSFSPTTKSLKKKCLITRFVHRNLILTLKQAIVKRFMPFLMVHKAFHNAKYLLQYKAL